MAQEQRRIPFDPVKWVENLMDVAAKSDFSYDQKEFIASHLEKLKDDLENHAMRT